jgi:hydantoinase/carbamoylase family amidase
MTAIAEAIRAAATFGATSNGGVTRFAWSEPLFGVYAWLRERAAEAGFESRLDAAGNLIVIWDAGQGPVLAIGSHLDTVPNGGRYDGALGVLSGLEAMKHLKRRGFQPNRPVWLIAFMDEEGARFKTTMLGSRAFVGEDLQGLSSRRDGDGVTLAEAMRDAGFPFDRLPEARAIERVGEYLELHIEQGPVLEQAGVDVGIVTGISGLRGTRASFKGIAAHSGTTPMHMRRDALAGAARAVLEIRDVAASRDGTLATVGTMNASPGAFNVVPCAAEFNVDIRSIDPGALESSEADLHRLLQRIADEEQLTVSWDRIYELEPLPLDERLIATCELAATEEGASHQRLPSGAGHDAMIIGRHVPAAMLFLPSQAGISHNPVEHTSDEDCERGTRVLARAVERLSSQPMGWPLRAGVAGFTRTRRSRARWPGWLRPVRAAPAAR